MPAAIHPMLATLVDDPFSNPEWIFETKWDGFRSVCFIRNGRARFVSRNQLEMTSQYPELADVTKHIDAKEAILDGEIVALDQDGMPRFQLLQPRVGRKGGIEALRGKGHIVYYVFDLIYLDGYDLTACALVERKAALERILRPSNFIKFSDHVEGNGKEFFKQIEKFKLEGMLAKRAGSPYVQKRKSKQSNDRKSSSPATLNLAELVHTLAHWLSDSIAIVSCITLHMLVVVSIRSRSRRSTNSCSRSRLSAVLSWLRQRPMSRFNG